MAVPLRKETMPPGGLGDPVGTWICVPYPSSCPNVGWMFVRLSAVMNVVTFTACAAACPACTSHIVPVQRALRAGSSMAVKARRAPPEPFPDVQQMPGLQVQTKQYVACFSNPIDDLTRQTVDSNNLDDDCRHAYCVRLKARTASYI